jgi:hypothetical protein
LDRVPALDAHRSAPPLASCHSILVCCERDLILEALLDLPDQRIGRPRNLERDAARLRPRQSNVLGQVLDNESGFLLVLAKKLTGETHYSHAPTVDADNDVHIDRPAP